MSPTPQPSGASASTASSTAGLFFRAGSVDVAPRASAPRLSAPARVADRPLVVEPPAAAPRVVPKERSEAANRMLNVAVASVALVLVSPIMLAAAILVKATSRGPIFYVQTRVGADRRSRRGRMDDPIAAGRRIRDLGGACFHIYKFRSMTVDAEKASGAVWASKTDSRVTPVGKLLRACRVDELPQLLNVIKGDMNIVGPRPERPSIFARLSEGIDNYPLRQLAKPGITGWAQINQSYDTCEDDVRSKLRYDLEYLQRQCLTEDIKIMARTLPVMILKKGGW
jgi:lipopolysaccharide/colanic/teichoic acid biosynthesis glycosyltransferase